MAEPRLKSEIWIKAYIRRVQVAGAFAAIVKRGDAEAGVPILRINRLDGTSVVLSPATRGDGARVWQRLTGKEPAPDADADKAIERQLKFDSDLWVVEVDDREGRFFVDEKVE